MHDRREVDIVQSLSHGLSEITACYETSIFSAVNPLQQLGRAHHCPRMGLVGDGEKLDYFVHSLIIEHLEVACLLDECLRTDVIELLDRETCHLDEGTCHGIGVLTAHQTGTVGCELRHSAPIVEGELQATGYQTATGNSVYSPVDYLCHKMVQHVLRLDVPDFVAYDEENLVTVTKVY